MKKYGVKAYLTLSGLVLGAVGGFISLTPITYLDHFKIYVSQNISFISDLRSMGGNLIIFGFLALLGSFNKRFEKTATLTTFIVFASYAIFRILAILFDGLPNNTILVAAIIEIIFALIGYKFLIKNKIKTQQRSIK
jgi:hypothetical protein